MTAEEQQAWLQEPHVPRETMGDHPEACPDCGAELVAAFTVRGQPVPKGALVRSPHGGLYNRDAKRLSAWSSAIVGEASGAMGDRPVVRGPVRVDAVFVLTRPQAHYLPANAKRSTRLLRPDAPRWAATKPDVDKLERALFDALTNVVIADDDQIVAGDRRKVYEDPANVGVTIRIELVR